MSGGVHPTPAGKVNVHTPQRSTTIHGADGAFAPGAELVTASFNADVTTLAELLALPGYEVNATDRRTGRNALHEACAQGHERVVRLLFEHGANAHTRTILGRESPLHLAAQNGHDVICKLLLKRGVKPDRHNGQGFAPLHITSSSAVCFVLLAGGANPYARSRDGKSAMSIAAEKGNEGVYEQLAAKFAGKMRKESIRERKMMKERKEHYLQALAEERQERIKQKKQDQMKSYLKFRWA